jgi:hypothetical protein
LTVTPDPGYKLNEIKVFIMGTTIEVPLSGSGSVYTFKMPAAHITIVAVFGSTTAIDEIAQGLKAYAQDGVLHISGLSEGQPFSIYNITGTLIYSSVANADKIEILLPGRGMYIIRSGDYVIKVSH